MSSTPADSPLLPTPPTGLHQSQQSIQHTQQPQSLLQQKQTPQPLSVRKRRKTEGVSDDPPAPSEPRRLRRSHEACSRCRSKKIKCDSKHPRCTACAAANTTCHQEDRIRQTLTPRGHTEHLEHLLTQCDALLKRYIPSFNLANLDELLAREGIDLANVPPPTGMQYTQPGTSRSPQQQAPMPFRPESSPASPDASGQKVFTYHPPQQHLLPPGYPIPIPYGPPPPGVPYIQGPFNPHIHPAFQQHPHPHPLPPPFPPPSVTQSQPLRQFDVPGQDPQANDLSNTESLCKSFGVSEAIVNDFRLGNANPDKEDLAVGSNGLTSGRDRDIAETSTPRDASKWLSVSVRRNSNPGLLALGPAPTSIAIQVWLPKDRKMVARIIDIYFSRLNIHRPVFIRADFDKTLSDLYDGQMVPHDPGFCCSLYLILALGTLSDLNHRATQLDQDGDHPDLGPILARQLMPSDWPDYDEFFERALAVKPDLRVTISSLQALILLHWYLYTERQGRTLWRLAGSLVRLAIELGLHHDPTTQQGTFTEAECQLRIRLWAIVMVHDRGTSILLGRPLAIAPTDSNTPSPECPKTSEHFEFSEHFAFSSPIADIQADIINSLYTPKSQTGQSIMRHAIRIIRSMVEFRRKLPDTYKFYFGGNEELPLDQRSKIVRDITEDQGLTFLKLGIARILLFRAVFNAKDLVWECRHKALADAVVTSHNIIIVHKQLIKFPEIGFFTSPIPLHIAAMIILYGHMSNCDRLSKQVALEDIWLALDMLPRFRWRWERKDLKGNHPLLAKLAERVMEVDLHTVKPPVHAVLLSEEEWESYETPVSKPSAKSQQSTPTLSNSSYPSPNGTTAPYHNIPSNNGGPGTGTPPDKQLMDVPPALFYPFFPENQISIPMDSSPTSPRPTMTSGSNGNANSTNGALPHRADYRNLLAAATPHLQSSYGCQPSHDSFMSEERDASFATQQHPQGMQMWVDTAGLTASHPPSRRPPTYTLRPA